MPALESWYDILHVTFEVQGKSTLLIFSVKYTKELFYMNVSNQMKLRHFQSGNKMSMQRNHTRD